MPGELVPITGVADFMRASKAKNTQVAYASDLKHFERWCAGHLGHLGQSGQSGQQNESLPASPETVAIYLAALAATHKFATIRRRVAAIAFAHRSIGVENPIAHPGVKQTLEGIARTLGSAPTKKAALTAELLAKAVRKIRVERRPKFLPHFSHTSPTLNPLSNNSRGGDLRRPFGNPIIVEPDLSGLRDKALLLLGFAGALRRSELVQLDVADVVRHAKGALLYIRRSKTDQTGAGLIKAIPHGKKLKAIEALETWIQASNITEGALFRAVHGSTVLATRLTAGQVARIIKKRAAAIGLDPALFSGHSLRSGFITSAAEHGASLSKIADQAGHSKLDTTRGYMQVADAFRDHSGKRFL